MPARNPITGDRLTTGPASEDYRANFDRIFRKQAPIDPPIQPDAVPAQTGPWTLADETDEEAIARLRD